MMMGSGTPTAHRMQPLPRSPTTNSSDFRTKLIGRAVIETRALFPFRMMRTEPAAGDRAAKAEPHCAQHPPRRVTRDVGCAACGREIGAGFAAIGSGVAHGVE